jgi:hypothetical protein
MTEQQTNEPVSWLRLERYHLGELSTEEAAEVARAIATDPATRECFEIIQRPSRLKPLPELPSGSSPPGQRNQPVLLNPRPAPPSAPPEPPRGVVRLLRTPIAMTLLAAAAALLLYVIARPSEQVDGMPAARFHTKGGDVAMELVRERAGGVTMHPATFGDADHFKVMLTCPPSMAGRFEVMVFQGTDVFRPLSPLEPVACGNGVPLPGAFALDGTLPSTVCVAWGEAAQGGIAEHGGPAALSGKAVCTTVVPEH